MMHCILDFIDLIYYLNFTIYIIWDCKMFENRQKKTPIQEDVFLFLRERIMCLDYPPGMLLLEKGLCKELKSSRTPVREAIIRLKEMGLVTVMPRYGTFVSVIDMGEIRSAFEVKVKLDNFAGTIAAIRISEDELEDMTRNIEETKALIESENVGFRELNLLDERFHRTIYEATQNVILAGFLENLRCRCSRLWNPSLQEAISLDEIITQKQKILRFLRDRDGEKAGQACEDHVQYFIDKIKQHIL